MTSQHTHGLLKILVEKSGASGILTITLMVMTSLCQGLCPRDPLTSANACMEAYSSQYDQMINSDEQLFTGINIEYLRLFCTGFKTSMQCVEDLKSQCPTSKHDLINNALINLDGSKDALHDLCKDDQIYDVYAQSMTCYMMQRHTSLMCFRKNMNVTIKLLATYSGNIHYLCRDLAKVIECIKGNILTRCGRDAGKLVATLVRPMVRHSTQCYVNDLKRTRPPHKRKRVHKERKGLYRTLNSSVSPINSPSFSYTHKNSSLLLFLSMTFCYITSRFNHFL